MEPKSSETIVVSVLTLHDRDVLVKRIYTSLTREASTDYLVVQDQVNRVKIFMNVNKDYRVLIKTYIILVIPVIMDLGPLHSLYGNIDFHLEKTISHLQSIVKNLQSLQGRRIVKGNRNDQASKQLAESLRGIQ